MILQELYPYTYQYIVSFIQRIQNIKKKKSLPELQPLLEEHIQAGLKLDLAAGWTEIQENKYVIFIQKNNYTHVYHISI